MSEDPSKLDISDEMIAERRGGSGKMPEDMPLWMAKSIVNIDKFSYKKLERTLKSALIKSRLITDYFNVAA